MDGGWQARFRSDVFAQCGSLSHAISDSRHSFVLLSINYYFFAVGLTAFGIAISVCRGTGHGDAICVKRPKEFRCISGHTLIL
jgi:hypothetical protein